MKIALICDSLLLDRSLEMYLKEYLTSYKLCDFVVATQRVESQKPVFLIGDFEEANLKIPFTREMLLQELENFDRKVRGKAMQESQNEEPKSYRDLQGEIFAKSANDSSGFGDLNRLDNLKQEIPPFFEDSALNAEIEEVLRSFAKEIQTIVLEHYRDKNA
ncbi:MAG: hypothetical protein K2N75_02875 [Helicobacter sp.]|uniref:hypothetical protein n=1 Tax=Helicobacter sp. TaxID=218 RepID=UPI0023D6509B|nr:hypothetical protein [Helicobacter sp.]MDE5925570.1 hypothetical protein [Helicobacter sp.]MDE7174984.1 hypothetical protein [Helicobacter sp.]